MEKEKTSQEKIDSINFKSYLSSLIIIFCLMIFAYVLTFVLKSGTYENNVYSLTPENIKFPWWKFALSPFLVLGFDGNTLLIAIIAFLCVIGGVFEALTRCKFMEYTLKKLVNKFYNKRYVLICILVAFFMLLGSFVGTFEEVIPMIPFICALTCSLGFDNLIGIGVSLLAAGSGFACGIMNPFTIGIAQQIADVPLFSGAWLRILTFIIIYATLTSFLMLHAKRVEKKNTAKVQDFKMNFVKNPKMDKAIWAFGGSLLTGLVLVMTIVILGSRKEVMLNPDDHMFISSLRDGATLPIIALAFLVGGIIAALLSGMKLKDLLKAFGKGAIQMLPAVLLILIASSIRYILVESQRIDTLIYDLMKITDGLSPYVLMLFIYFVVFLVEIFIASGSAKAFLLIPLILPISEAFGIPANLICLAYIFGDGFSNYIYPTDAALLISLKLSDYTYAKYMKRTWVYHLLSIIITAGILMFGLAIGYK